MNEISGWVGAGFVGALVTAIGAFLRSALLAQKATSEQIGGWQAVIAAKDAENQHIAAERDALRAQVLKLEAEVYAMRRRLEGR